MAVALEAPAPAITESYNKFKSSPAYDVVENRFQGKFGDKTDAELKKFDTSVIRIMSRGEKNPTNAVLRALEANGNSDIAKSIAASLYAGKVPPVTPAPVPTSLPPTGGAPSRIQLLSTATIPTPAVPPPTTSSAAPAGPKTATVTAPVTPAHSAAPVGPRVTVPPAPAKSATAATVTSADVEELKKLGTNLDLSRNHANQVRVTIIADKGIGDAKEALFKSLPTYSGKNRHEAERELLTRDPATLKGVLDGFYIPTDKYGTTLNAKQMEEANKARMQTFRRVYGDEFVDKAEKILIDYALNRQSTSEVREQSFNAGYSSAMSSLAKKDEAKLQKMGKPVGIPTEDWFNRTIDGMSGTTMMKVYLTRDDTKLMQQAGYQNPNQQPKLINFDVSFKGMFTGGPKRPHAYIDAGLPGIDGMKKGAELNPTAPAELKDSISDLPHPLAGMNMHGQQTYIDGSPAVNGTITGPQLR